MTREWKPGDVAMIPFAHGEEISLRVPSGWVNSLYPTPVSGYSEARPLVVIDPEDMAQVQRLTADIPMADQDDVQAALREFATPTPPKPDEPQGLGAVVEDTEGQRWVRDGRKGNADNWFRADRPGCRPYADLDIRHDGVLSEGVTP